MGKVKPKKKDTFIDMTAMSDVTVLLLTFFMLTSTFLTKEPVVVLTPSSVSEEKVPEQNLITVLVDPEGRCFVAITGGTDESGTAYKSEDVRKDLLRNAVAEYNKLHPSNKISLTQKQEETFSRTAMFGVPMQQLSKWLDMEQTKMDEFIDPKKNPNCGIPIVKNEDRSKPDEFQIWMLAASNSENPAIQAAIKSGKGIAVKADRGTTYDKVQLVMDNLQTMKMNKFSLMTALKTEGE